MYLDNTSNLYDLYENLVTIETMFKFVGFPVMKQSKGNNTLLQPNKVTFHSSIDNLLWIGFNTSFTFKALFSQISIIRSMYRSSLIMLHDSLLETIKLRFVNDFYFTL